MNKQLKHIINNRIVKNLKLLLIVSFLLLINCKDDNSDSKTFLEKYNGTFWKNQNANTDWIDYFGFSKETLFLQIVSISGETNNKINCGKVHEGENVDYNVIIKKNSENELWVDLVWPNFLSTIKFIIDTNGVEMVAILIEDGKIIEQETYKLTNLSYDSLCN